MNKSKITIVLMALAMIAIYAVLRRQAETQRKHREVLIENIERAQTESLMRTTSRHQHGDHSQDGHSIVSSEQVSGTLDLSLRNEVNAAIDRALSWLAANQKENGAWSNDSFPALTALPVWAIAQRKHTSHSKALSKGVKFMLSNVQKDGGIYKNIEGRKGGGLSNYNTSICMTALHATGDKTLTPIVLKARKFVAGSQHLGGDVYDGGFGYDAGTDRKYADLLNTFYAAQAMRMTQDAEDMRPASEGRVDIDWKKTMKFIEQMQNTAEKGKDQEGGFFYMPGQSKAGSTTNTEGIVTFRSYGSMTYAGLLAMVYANVEKDDPRLLSAFHWSARNWSLSENPGMGAEGLFFFYNVLTRSLSAFGRDLVPAKSGKHINWRAELAKKLVELQKVDPKTGNGYWTNENGRFWENDPVLVTSYAILALEQL